MNLILCVDDQGGLSFHHRRQSRDRAVRTDILQMCKEKKLWVSSYTAQQFEEKQLEYFISSEEDFEHILADDFYFAENIIPDIDTPCVNQIILYHWNRMYPSDMKLSLPLTNRKCIKMIEFPGYSHEKITKEVYIR